MTDTSKESVERLAKEYDDRVAAFDAVVAATPELARTGRRQRGAETRQQHVITAATLRALSAALEDARAVKVPSVDLLAQAIANADPDYNGNAILGKHFTMGDAVRAMLDQTGGEG